MLAATTTASYAKKYISHTFIKKMKHPCMNNASVINVTKLTHIYLPTVQTANLLTPSCGEGKYSIYKKAPNMGPSMENEQLMLKRWELPGDFQGRIFKDCEGKDV